MAVEAIYLMVPDGVSTRSPYADVDIYKLREEIKNKMKKEKYLIRDDGSIYLVLSFRDAVAMKDMEIILVDNNGVDGVVDDDNSWSPHNTYAVEIGNIKDVLDTYMKNMQKAIGKYIKEEQM